MQLEGMSMVNLEQETPQNNGIILPSENYSNFKFKWTKFTPYVWTKITPFPTESKVKISI